MVARRVGSRSGQNENVVSCSSVRFDYSGPQQPAAQTGITVCTDRIEVWRKRRRFLGVFLDFRFFLGFFDFWGVR